MSGVGTAQLLDAGLVAPAAPGSFISYMLVTPKGGYFSVITAIVIACAVSFAVASVLMGFGRGEREQELHRPEDEVLVGT
jgi:PTS system mannitol-specific IIC component